MSVFENVRIIHSSHSTSVQMKSNIYRFLSFALIIIFVVENLR